MKSKPTILAMLLKNLLFIVSIHACRSSFADNTGTGSVSGVESIVVTASCTGSTNHQVNLSVRVLARELCVFRRGDVWVCVSDGESVEVQRMSEVDLELPLKLWPGESLMWDQVVDLSKFVTNGLACVEVKVVAPNAPGGKTKLVTEKRSVNENGRDVWSMDIQLTENVRKVISKTERYWFKYQHERNVWTAIDILESPKTPHGHP